MHLDKLFIRNFKKFRRADIEFQDGLTGIVGSNGSGKSTIVEAVAWALYGNRASSVKRDYIRNVRSSESDSVEIRLDLSLGSRQLTIYRTMKGRGMMPEANLLLDGQRIAVGTKEVDKRLEEILKISYQDFMKTFYARQKDLDNLLKEGGSGKREYLLKLLGLYEIREKAIDTVKSDYAALDERKNRLTGALAEIGDVEAKRQKVALDTNLAKASLEEAQRAKSAREIIAINGRSDLEAMSEKMRSHGHLAERVAKLEAQETLESENINAARKRLAEIDIFKKRLADLGPMLERLSSIKKQLETIEPKRVIYEKNARQLAATEAALKSDEKAILENKKALFELERDSFLHFELEPAKEEYTKLEAHLLDLEAQRDRYGELQARQKEEIFRLDAALANLSRTNKAIDDLQKDKARFKEIASCIEEEKKLKSELAELVIHREKQKELQSLTSRKTIVEMRRSRLEGEAAEARQKLQALGDLEKKEVELRLQDKDLDTLITDLNNILADLRGSLKLQDLAVSEVERSIEKVKALGPDGLCPTCERPLQDQCDHLLGKYEVSLAQAREKREKLKAKVAAQSEMLDGATRSRSNLRLAFDDLNAKKRDVSVLKANLQSLTAQIFESQSEQEEITSNTLALGDVRFDSQRLASVESAIKSLEPFILECSSLIMRLEDLPHREAERSYFENEVASHEERREQLKKEILALSYSESEYIASKKRIAALRPLYDRFLLLKERVAQIPILMDKIAGQEAERERLASALEFLENSQSKLGFDHLLYDSLHNERKDLSGFEDEAQRIRVIIAAQDEIQIRLGQVEAAWDRLEAELVKSREELSALQYSPEEHETVRQRLARAEEELEKARKIVSEKTVAVGVLKSELDRLIEEGQRKKELETGWKELGQGIEVVETTRSLINSFMDRILIRVKNDIAKTAGEILEEVSGKYRLLKIDDDFNILVEDGGEYYPISRYSGGEIDMIAVSVRVAISEYLMRFGPDGESYSFLILDEVFGGQDIEHRETMIQMLRSLEERFPQIIAISHISDVQGQFDNTLLVVEDDAGNSRIEVL